MLICWWYCRERCPLSSENGGSDTTQSGSQEGTFQIRVSRSLDTVAVMFDDDNLVANAGLILPATLAQHLGLETLINERVRLTDSSAGLRPGRKALTLVH